MNRLLIETCKTETSERITAFYADPPDGFIVIGSPYWNRLREDAKLLAKRSGRTLPKNFHLRVSNKSH